MAPLESISGSWGLIDASRYKTRLRPGTVTGLPSLAGQGISGKIKITEVSLVRPKGFTLMHVSQPKVRASTTRQPPPDMTSTPSTHGTARDWNPC